MEQIKTVLEIIALLGTIAIIPVYRFVVKPFWKRYKDSREQFRQEVLATLAQHTEKINSMHHELHPNGGSSVNDKVTRIEGSVRVMVENIQDLKDGQRGAMDILGAATWESDGNGRVTFVSGAMCVMLGCAQSDIMDFSWRSRLIHADRERICNAWDNSVKHAGDFDEICTFRKSNGKLVRVRMEAVHIKGPGGVLKSSIVRIHKIDTEHTAFNGI
jgi:PAS domain-containing protein